MDFSWAELPIFCINKSWAKKKGNEKIGLIQKFHPLIILNPLNFAHGQKFAPKIILD
jgi:hypothetical protein